MSLFHLDTVFKCHRCATVRENLNLETVHVCRCRDSGPVWQQVRRWRPNWTLILAVLLCGAIAYCVWNAVLWWHSPENREEPALREECGVGAGLWFFDNGKESRHAPRETARPQ